jgi:hypothetical protein
LGLDATRVIDLAIEDGWRTHALQPAAPITDSLFVRRLYLDLVGRVPKSMELQCFLADTDSRKRESLVDSLLASDEHAEHFAEIFDAILIGRIDPEPVRRRSEARGDTSRGEAEWRNYLQRAFRENRPWNVVVRDIVSARPEASQDRGAAWYLYSRKNKSQDIAEAVSKDVFGVRIDCAQCHDHPLADEIKQKHYWGLVAFFNRSKNVDTPQGPQVSESAIGGFSDFSNLQGQAQPNELIYLGDRRIEEARPAKDAKEEDLDELYRTVSDGQPRVPKFSRREQFVEQIMKEHPLVSQAIVNRLWGWMMGRGLVHPVDTLDSYHPASHPGLLDWLARDFVASGHNLRRLLRSLALTRLYQLNSSQESFADPQWFSTALCKPLTAEMLHRSLLVVLDPEKPDQWNAPQQRLAFAKLFPDVQVEESLSNVAQGLLLTNGQAINELCSIKQSRLLQSLNQVSDNGALIQQLFMSILGREADETERQRCQTFLSPRIEALSQDASSSACEQRGRAIEGLAWALVTSSEFRFNH